MAALGGIGAGLGILGSVASTIGRVQAIDAQSKALSTEATSLEEQAAYNERQSRRAALLVRGKANAEAAASGISISSGSPLFMELDRAKQSELEALNIRRSGEVAAAGKRYESRMARRMIPWTIAGGIGQAGSALTSLIGR